MRQRSDQTVDQFLSEIRNQIRKSGLDGDAQKDNMIRDKLRSGILDEKCKEKLVNKGDDLTLADAIKIARNYEATRKELQLLPQASVIPETSSKEEGSSCQKEESKEIPREEGLQTRSEETRMYLLWI